MKQEKLAPGTLWSEGRVALFMSTETDYHMVDSILYVKTLTAAFSAVTTPSSLRFKAQKLFQWFNDNALFSMIQSIPHSRLI